MVNNDKTYWTSKNGLWKIGKWETDRGLRWYIENTDTGYNDNPIVYEDGRVTFDNPYNLPKYVKKQFKILANKDFRTVKAPEHQRVVKKGKENVSDADIATMKEIRDDSIFETMLNEKRGINRMLNLPFFRIKTTENMGNPEVERIVSEMIDIANEDFISKVNSGVTDLLLNLDDEIPLIYKTTRDIMLEEYR